MTPATHLVVLTLSWLAYGAIHSLLASQRAKRAVKRRHPNFYRGYRLTYNLLALALLAVPGALLLSYPGEPLWQWPPVVRWVADGAALLAVGGFVWSASIYDNREFLGISQLSANALPDDTAPMSISTAHRWVRHPWYFLGLVIVWTRQMDAALLVTAIVLTFYLVIGSRLEENKLIAQYGERYRCYRDRVPGLVPLPWRHLSKTEAASILRTDNDRQGNPDQ